MGQRPAAADQANWAGGGWGWGGGGEGEAQEGRSEVLGADFSWAHRCMRPRSLPVFYFREMSFYFLCIRFPEVHFVLCTLPPLAPLPPRLNHPPCRCRQLKIRREICSSVRDAARLPIIRESIFNLEEACYCCCCYCCCEKWLASLV